MHLILSSCDFSNESSKKCILENMNKPIENCKVLYFPNEKATLELIQSEKYYNRLQGYGFLRDNIYVYNYFNSTGFDNLELDCVYISGGNTFQMLDLIKKSGADKLIKQYVHQGVTYIGGSAGAHIVTKNIEHLLSIDPNTTNVIDYSGLSLFDGIIFCHFSDKIKSLYDNAVEKGEYQVYALTDDESIICVD